MHGDHGDRYSNKQMYRSFEVTQKYTSAFKNLLYSFVNYYDILRWFEFPWERELSDFFNKYPNRLTKI